MTMMISGTELAVKTFEADTVYLSTPAGREEIKIEDFLAVVEYVLTNTNLEKDDPRLVFIERIRNSKVVDGYPAIIAGQQVEGMRIAVGEER